MDTTLNRDPVEPKVGHGRVLEGVDEAVVGLEKGEKRSVVVPLKKGYGQRQEGLTEKVPLCSFVSVHYPIREGSIVEIRSERGGVQLATVLGVPCLKASRGRLWVNRFQTQLAIVRCRNYLAPRTYT